MTKHIIYLKDQKPICEDPARLGSDFVISSVAFGKTCADCNAVLFTHNKNEFAREYNRAHLMLVPPAAKPEKKPMVDRLLPWAVIILSLLLIALSLKVLF